MPKENSTKAHRKKLSRKMEKIIVEALRSGVIGPFTDADEAIKTLRAATGDL